jgi:diacylglycerol O-acyltransferase / wax synthase
MMGGGTDRSTESRFARLGPGDLTMLLTDRGNVPMNTGAIQVFEHAPGPVPAVLRTLLRERVVTVPRLRQRVQRLPLGCGRPVWVDDADFAVENHLVEREVSGATGPQELLDLAADLVCERLPLEHPPWRACVVVDSGSGLVVALIFVAQHVMADGLGGLAVLSALADPGLAPAGGVFPRRRPPYRDLVLDAARQRARRVTTLRLRLRLGLAGLRELRIGHGHPRPAGMTSLTRPTSGRRRLSTVHAPLADLVAAAHAAGGTVNDVVLAAVTGALLGLLAERGEHPPGLVVSVPISARARTDADHLGNQTGVRPVEIPAIRDDQARLRSIVALTRAAAGTPRASSAAPLGFAFRLIARLGLFAWFVDHQRLVDTFETNLRGPVERLEVGGHPVSAIIPMAVNPGNVGVSFDVLSYAGNLGITLVADPESVPDLDLLTGLLSDTLARLCTSDAAADRETSGTSARGRASTSAGEAV